MALLCPDWNDNFIGCESIVKKLLGTGLDSEHMQINKVYKDMGTAA